MVLNMSRFLLVLALICLFNNAASAQSVYVAGAIGADISFVSGQESIPFAIPTGGGEAFSGAARLGVLLDQRWGIELEVSRAGEIKETSNFGPVPLPLGAARPSFLTEIESRKRITTVSATASIRQQVSGTVALAYLGGVVFHRTDSRMEFLGYQGPPARGDFVFSDGPALLALVVPYSRVESVAYGAGPVVGFEAHIGYGEHFLIIPGVRLHGLPASWLLRPGIGAGWSF